MSEAHASAWWDDVAHLREAAERRSAERAKARIEGRKPVALTPLQPLAVDGLAAFEEAIDAVEPVAPGEAPRRRRFARPVAARRPASIPANVPHTDRRTVEIRGRTKPPVVELVPDQANDVGPIRRRPKRRLAERCVGSPDRVALYAFLLGLFLILVALLSAHGG